MYEYELEAVARFVYTKLGARGDAFSPIVASGPNTLIWHYSANNRQMQAGEVVYMDYGALRILHLGCHADLAGLRALYA